MSLKSELIIESVQKNFIHGTFIALALFLVAAIISFLIFHYTKKTASKYRLFPLVILAIINIILFGTVVMGVTYTLQPIEIVEGVITKIEIITRKDYIQSKFKKYPGRYAYLKTASGEEKFYLGPQTAQNIAAYLNRQNQYVLRKEELIGIIEESKVIMNHKTIDINQ